MHALILCAVQFLLAVTWTLYVAFLPQLAAQAGVPRVHVAWILMMDQVIFVAMDFALGIAADRVAGAMRALGGWMLALSLASALAFVLLPGATSPAVLVGLTAIWAATSSALRAPPMVIIARRLQTDRPTFLVGCSLLGIGVAGAIAPLLTARLREVSPLLPFAMASVALVLAVAALRAIEPTALRGQASRAPVGDGGGGADSAAAGAASPAPADRRRPARIWPLFLAVCLLALGFQIHTAVNSAPAFLRFVDTASLVRVMPAFWVGFALCVLLPDVPRLRSYPPHVLLLLAASLGALSLAGFVTARSLETVLVAQVVAGGLWGIAFGSAANAALDAGHVGREGAFAGLVFAVAAVAAFVRIAMVASGASKSTELAGVLPWLPALAWGVAALLLWGFVQANRPYPARQVQPLRQRPGSS